jgi:hypothetical protein
VAIHKTVLGRQLIELRRVLEDAVKEPERIAEVNRLTPEHRIHFLDVLGATEMMLEHLRTRVIPPDD